MIRVRTINEELIPINLSTAKPNFKLKRKAPAGGSGRNSPVEE
jgi:hypothetical protein